MPKGPKNTLSYLWKPCKNFVFFCSLLFIQPAKLNPHVSYNLELSSTCIGQSSTSSRFGLLVESADTCPLLGPSDSWVLKRPPHRAAWRNLLLGDQRQPQEWQFSKKPRALIGVPGFRKRGLGFLLG